MPRRTSKVVEDGRRNGPVQAVQLEVILRAGEDLKLCSICLQCVNGSDDKLVKHRDKCLANWSKDLRSIMAARAKHDRWIW